MRTLYFECFAGISGDMTLGALLDLGVDKERLIMELNKLDVQGYKLEISKKAKNGIMGTNIDVVLENCNIENHNDGEHHHRNFKYIRELIETSDLDDKVKELSVKMFYNVAKAEGKIHGKPLDEVHFHEVGAIDSIVDIVGVAICINELKVDKIVSSPLNLGMGTVRCQHGVIPVPAPATLEILKECNVPIYTSGIKMETVTPTGAAIIATLSEEFDDMPEGVVHSIGYGCGKRDMEIANMLRLVIIESKKKH